MNCGKLIKVCFSGLMLSTYDLPNRSYSKGPKRYVSKEVYRDTEEPKHFSGRLHQCFFVT